MDNTQWLALIVLIWAVGFAAVGAYSAAGVLLVIFGVIVILHVFDDEPFDD